MCDSAIFGSKNHSIKYNTVVGTLSGVAIFPVWGYTLDNANCLKLSYFTVFKSVYYGIYYNNELKLMLENNILVDNQINIFTRVIHPDVLAHVMSNKTVTITNSIIVGKSDSFKCDTDLLPDDLSFVWARTAKSYGAGLDSTGKIGIVWSDFNSGTNSAPYKPWYYLFNYFFFYF